MKNCNFEDDIHTLLAASNLGGQHFPRHIPRQFLCSLGLAGLRAGMRVIGVETRTHGVGAVAVLALVARGGRQC